jgi:flagellar biosynthesis GTPase FlhF
MATIAVIISIIALAGAGFAFIRAASSHHILGKRIEDLKERIKYLEANQNRLQNAANRGNKPVLEQEESVRRNQPKQEQQKQERQEPRQKQKERQPQERQTHQSERPQQERRHQERPQQQDANQQEQQRRKKENRRRNEPRERADNFEEPVKEQQLSASDGIRFEVVGSHLLDELEQQPDFSQSAPMPEQEPEVIADSGIRYAIIPEDGVIRQHHLQRQPDSDSYIEVDVAAEGSNMTHYRFNLSGNHAFVISQGIDRLENAFDFEKPSNRMVNRIVQQQDGVLAKVNNGWRIQEKARIDFR